MNAIAAASVAASAFLLALAGTLWAIEGEAIFRALRDAGALLCG